MLSLLFSPVGRISPWSFWRGSFVLIALGFGLDFIDIFDNVPDNLALGLLLALLYPWACLLIKRMHAGGKSGWWATAYIALYIVLQILVIIAVLYLFNRSFFSVFAELIKGKISDAEYDVYLEILEKSLMVPIASVSLFIRLVIVWLIDKFTPEVTDETISEIFS